jgi:hypothetical protein
MLKTVQIQAVIAFGTGGYQATDLSPGAAGLFGCRSILDEVPSREVRISGSFDVKL